MSIKKDKRLALEKGATIEALQEVYDVNLKDVVFHSRRQSDVPAIEKAYRACVIFAQENGGSGVCLNEKGLILTCAHCLRKPTLGQKHYVIFTNGLVCLTESVFVDEIADVAFIQASLPAHVETLAYASFAAKFVKRETLYCVGQPYPFDLESDEGESLDFPLISVSKGSLREVLPGDVLDNSDIGKLRHTCWTYWGHSGAPLFNRSGEIVGIHSSWDDETCSRHGVVLECLLHCYEQIEIN